MNSRYLNECFEYDELSGIVYWKSRQRSHFKTERGFKTFNSQKYGKEAGTLNNCGYLQIRLNKKLILVHRLIIMLKGCELSSEDHVDHINHNRTDNRLINLRVVSQKENNKNLNMRKSNTTGITGVSFSVSELLWYPRIQVDYRNIYLGATKDFFEACCRRKSAELKYNFHKNHGEFLNV